MKSPPTSRTIPGSRAVKSARSASTWVNTVRFVPVIVPHIHLEDHRDQTQRSVRQEVVGGLGEIYSGRNVGVSGGLLLEHRVWRLHQDLDKRTHQLLKPVVRNS